ncbi:MAG TPA: prolyl oligopeptidase family serine peptidase [Kofleriaceae bacterium]|nr:prolyl oligopeptidase family serine peptidase [Kofleriaceae bacterium]
MTRSLVLLSLGVFACSTPPPPVAPTQPAPAAPPAPIAVPPDPAPVAAAPPPAVSGYDQPPKHVLDVLHAPSPPRPYLSPTAASILLVSWVDYPSITQVAEPYLKLAGVRLEPRTRRKHDTPGGYGVAPCARSLSIVDVATTTERPIALPPGGCADNFDWTADGKRFAFRNTSSNAVELWLGDVASASVHRLGDARLNPMLGGSMQWLGDQKTLLVKLVPDHQAAPPAAAAAIEAPSIQESDGQKGESSTYETRDTLNDKHDEDLFEYYGMSQLAVVDSTTGAITRVGSPAVLTDVDPSPDDHFIHVAIIRKPYSYVTTFERFAHDDELWDRSGHTVAVLAKLPVADRVPVAGVPVGPRDFEWRSTEPATLVWTEALDDGDWKKTVPNRDKVMTQSAPFSAPATELARTEQRFAGFDWGEQRSIALLHEYDENRHWTRTFVMNPDKPADKARLLWDMSSDEKYKDPGSPFHRTLANGQSVMRQDHDSIFLDGEGQSAEGIRPFVDTLDLTTFKTERLFRSDKQGLEWALGFGDAANHTLVTWRQSPTDPPNAFSRTLGDAIAAAQVKPGEATRASTSRPITHIPDPTPEVRAIKKRLVKYKRKDGLELSFTLYTPPGYVEGTRIPAILYAYPLDYASAAQAGEVSGTDQLFTRITDYRLLLLSGYALIDDAAFPIVGDPKRAYDTYLEQLVADAQAAVDKAVETGVVDRDRIGVTGHSHGALMTANLIAHTDLFRAGVATSGSYNKTLTPFGFQNERRSVWTAQSVYLKVSPFFFADKIKLPLLIVHGADDANPGTTPLQAVKLFQAIRGNGGTTRLVMLPHEPHWYSAMESNEQLAYEELRWFDKYVKNAEPRHKQAKSPAPTASR